MRHAYLIIAHNNLKILEKNLKMIDNASNDIFIHIDKKSNIIEEKEIITYCKKSKIHFIERMDVKWGDFSLVECTINLFKAASKTEFDYCHLISGVDLVIKNNIEINRFFEENYGKEFINFCTEEELQEKKIRGERYYFTKNLKGSMGKINIGLNLISEKIQGCLNIRRNKGIEIKKGSNWVSVTKEFVDKIIENEMWIKKTFKNTLCCDELFLQTLVYHLKLEDKVYKKFQEGDISNSLREIDWNRGAPYSFRKEDFDLLMNSPNIFARKFDEKVDIEIVELIYRYVKGDNMQK